MGQIKADLEAARIEAEQAVLGAMLLAVGLVASQQAAQLELAHVRGLHRDRLRQRVDLPVKFLIFDPVVPIHADVLGRLRADSQGGGSLPGPQGGGVGHGLSDVGEEHRAVREAVRWFEQQGARTVEVSLPNAGLGVPVYYVIAPAEASSNLSRFDGVRYGHRAKDYADLRDMYCRTRAEGFGTEVKRRILIGTYVLSAGYYDAYYLKAQKVRTLIKRDFDEAWGKVDVVLTPTTPSPAFAFGEKSGDPIAMYLEDIFTVTVNMAGLPGISVPGGLSSQGTPLGLQLIAKPFDEETLFRAGQAIEDAAGRFTVEDRWWSAGRAATAAKPARSAGGKR